jgi:tetratricopeptide (TPR) repeat protein
MATRFIQLESTIRRAAVVFALVVCLAATFFFVKWCLANAVSTQTEYKEIAEIAASLAPSDPQPHFSSGALLEKTFLPGDIPKSLAEYEKATALSPHNYLFWLALGKARERAGEPEAAEKALRRAAALAPNYGHVRWTLGNILVRQGKTEEGFGEIRAAAESDASFMAPAIASAWQIFDGDIAAVKKAIGDSMQTNAALAVFLTKQKRFDESLAAWNALPAEAKTTAFKQNGEELYSQMIANKKYRFAAELYPQIFPSAAQSFALGKIDNGSFERDVKMREAAAFEWQIAEGSQPQIILDNQQKRGGERSLLFVYSTPDGKNLRGVSQIVAVEAAKKYRFSVFYKSDLKTAATLRWEIADAADGKVLAISGAVAEKADWTNLSMEFSTGGTPEAVVVRLVRGECKSAVCPISGKIWFDDLELATGN